MASFAVVLSLESLFKYPNPGLTGIILGMSLGNSIGSLLGSISHIHWCDPWIDTWQFFWRFNWVPSLLFVLLGTWHTNWHADVTFNSQLYGQVSWRISGIVFVILFYSPLEALFESDSWYNFLWLVVDVPLVSKVRYTYLVGSPLRATLAVPHSGSVLMFPSLPSGACPDSPSQAKIAVNFSCSSLILPRWCGSIWQCRKSKGDNKLE